MPRRPVVVITGAGGMGTAIAQRLGSGKHIILADFSSKQLATAENELVGRGHQVETVLVDVVDKQSVLELAKRASNAGGQVESVVHTAGLSPTMAPPKKIYEVDLVGTAHIIDAFHPIMTPGSAMVCVASIAGHNANLTIDEEKFFATAATESLLSSPAIDLEKDDQGRAYIIAKRANSLRVQAAAAAYGKKGARINSISPGAIFTPMIEQELNSVHGGHIRDMLEVTPAGRIGTAHDIADAVAFLTGRESGFVTGTDLRIDGGFTAMQRGSVLLE